METNNAIIYNNSASIVIGNSTIENISSVRSHSDHSDWKSYDLFFLAPIVVILFVITLLCINRFGESRIRRNYFQGIELYHCKEEFPENNGCDFIDLKHETFENHSNSKDGCNSFADDQQEVKAYEAFRSWLPQNIDPRASFLGTIPIEKLESGEKYKKKKHIVVKDNQVIMLY